MSQIAVYWLLVAVFTVGGIVLWFVARPMVRIGIWWQSRLTRQPGLQWSAKFVYDERTAVLIIGLIAAFWLAFAVVGAILLVVFSFVQLPKS